MRKRKFNFNSLHWGIGTALGICLTPVVLSFVYTDAQPDLFQLVGATTISMLSSIAFVFILYVIYDFSMRVKGALY